MANSNFFKKLDENNLPTGNLYILSNLKMIHPNTDFNNPTAVQELGYCYHLNTPKPIYTYGNYVKKWVNQGDVAVDGLTNTFDFNWQEIDETADLSAEELANRKSRAWDDLRDNRLYLLRRTDWWELPSQAPMSAERTAYRQALRDLPANTTDPFNVTWPKNPDTPEGAGPFELSSKG